MIHAPGTSDEFPFHVGSEGNGVLEIKDSAVFMTTDHLSVATSANAEGVLRISGGSVSALELSIGVRGDGVGIIGGAAKVSVATDMNVGSDSGGIGSLTVGGNAALDVGASALIGAGGSSVSAVNVTGTGPAIDIALDLNIGGGLSSNAAFNMSGGTLTVFRDTFLGSSSQSNAVLNYTGGSLALGGTLSILGEATLHIASPLLLQVTKGFHPGLALGEKLDVAGLILPAPNLDHVSAETGSAFFIQVGDRTGASGGEDFRTNTALEGLGLTGLSTPPGATRIPEVEFESGNFNPFTESVFALVEELIAGQLGRVGLRWTIAPVPPPPEILADFAAGNGLPADPYDNSDKDDATLLAEFAFNRDPTVNESLSLTPGTGTAGMPFISAVNLGENPHIRVEYIRRTKTTAPELTYSVQFGNSLATLMDYSGPETVIPIDPYWERVIVDDAETAATQPRRFGRVKVDYTPTP